MYYLSQFCRICVKTGGRLMDIRTVDFDSVSFSQKLELCTKMLVSRESPSTQICSQCVKKLRTAYDFHKMCKQSTKILQGYLSELISGAKVAPQEFVSSDLKVTIEPLRINPLKKFRKRRITKVERCSLLKRLLLSKKSKKKFKPKIEVHKHIRKPKNKGGLRNIINFTANYDFGYKIKTNKNCPLITEAAPLERLKHFTNTFFMNSFADYHNTILYIIENKDNPSDSEDDDEDMFEAPHPDQVYVKSEEVVVEPDIKIKTEVDYDSEAYNCNYYVETSFDEVEVKKEPPDSVFDSIEIKQEPLDYSEEPPGGDSVQILNKLVGNWGLHRKPFSQYSVRCRTRGNPYINPRLREQFELKSFQCTKCRRYFKSPGYLKAHISKLHHEV